jgi:hypothetical protein
LVSRHAVRRLHSYKLVALKSRAQRLRRDSTTD